MEITQDMLNEFSEDEEIQPYYIVKGMRGTQEHGYQKKIIEKFSDYDEAKKYYDSLDLTQFYAGREMEHCVCSDEIEQGSGDLIECEYIDELAEKMGDCDLCCRDKSFETYYVFKRGRKQELFSCVSCWESNKKQLEEECWTWTQHSFPGPAFFKINKDGEEEEIVEDEKEEEEEEEEEDPDAFECDDCNVVDINCFEHLGISKEEVDIYRDLGEPDRCEDCFEKWKNSEDGSEYLKMVNGDTEKDTPGTLETMSLDDIKYHLDKYGYVVVPNVLDKDEVEEYKTEFFNWFNNTPGLKDFHAKHAGNGILKFYEVAHQRFAWLVRTNPKVVDIFKGIWETDDLVTSFDGSCYYPEEFSGKANYWTHTDQSSRKVGRHCVQSFVSFTENVGRTLLLYHGSHYLHQDYFNITNTDTPNDWCVLDPDYLKGLDYRQMQLEVDPGSLVLWDSRVFHQNTCGPPHCREERLVQYVCYLPRNHENNTEEEDIMRRRCFENRINTSHWPYPVREVPQFPTWLSEYDQHQYMINYNNLSITCKPNIDDLREKIEKLI